MFIKFLLNKLIFCRVRNCTFFALLIVNLKININTLPSIFRFAYFHRTAFNGLDGGNKIIQCPRALARDFRETQRFISTRYADISFLIELSDVGARDISLNNGRRANLFPGRFIEFREISIRDSSRIDETSTWKRNGDAICSAKYHSGEKNRSSRSFCKTSRARSQSSREISKTSLSARGWKNFNYVTRKYIALCDVCKKCCPRVINGLQPSRFLRKEPICVRGCSSWVVHHDVDIFHVFERLINLQRGTWGLNFAFSLSTVAKNDERENAAKQINKWTDVNTYLPRVLVVYL